MAGVDLAPTFIEYARQAEREHPLGIQYLIGSGQDLPLASERFDLATAFMSLMDMPGPEAALREAWRVLRRAHPPFEIPRFHRTLSEWLNAALDVGFSIERIAEPHADEETAGRVPRIADTRIVAYYLHVRCRKAASPAPDDEDASLRSGAINA
jgi:SAM-dependent methyltransferase